MRRKKQHKYLAQQNKQLFVIQPNLQTGLSKNLGIFMSFITNQLKQNNTKHKKQDCQKFGHRILEMLLDPRSIHYLATTQKL